MEVVPQTRIEIIHSNFFKFLKENKISQKKYSVDNNIPESTISKWKSCTSNMNEEHIIQAAKYFNISVNMLYYTQQELKELNVKENKNYDPIIAQQQAEIVSIESKVCGISGFLVVNIGVLIAIMMIIGFLVDTFESIWPILFIVAFPVISFFSFKSILVERKKFIINYLDQLYYKTSCKKNRFFVLTLIFSFIQILLVVLTLIIYLNFTIQNGVHQLFYIVISFGCFSFVTVINNCIHLRLKMKEKIYDDEIEDYNYSLVVFCLNLTLTACSFPFFIDFMNNPWFLILPIIISVLSIINVVLISNKYSHYKLVLYDQKEDSERILFND